MRLRGGGEGVGGVDDVCEGGEVGIHGGRWGGVGDVGLWEILVIGASWGVGGGWWVVGREGYFGGGG